MRRSPISSSVLLASVLGATALFAGGFACSSDGPSGPNSGFDLGWFNPDGGGGDAYVPPPLVDAYVPPPPTDGTTPPPTDGTTTPPPTDGTTTPPPTDGTTPPPPPDATAKPDGPAPPLSGSFGGPFYEHQGGGLDVGSLVSGGLPPYVCSFYSGGGRGTVPSGVGLSGCKLSGGFGAGDPPGVYGFIVVVADQAQQQVPVPIVMRNGSCNTAGATLTPPEYPVRVINKPGSAYQWQWQISDVDTVCTDAQCTDCAGCMKHAVATNNPLKLAWFLDCQQDGDVCVTGADIENPASCPSPPVGWNAAIHVKAHTPLRSDGGPAWVTIEADAVYSGDTTGTNCGSKQWACHLEVLEQ